jgi:hypothetical protein
MRKQFSAWSLAALPLAAVASLLAGACLLAGCTGSGATSSSSAGPSSAGSNSAGGSGAGASSPAGGAAGSPAGTAPAATTPATTAPPAPGSAAAALAAALAALKSGRAVHVDITNEGPQGSVTFSDEATTNGGRQVITTSGGGHVTILSIAGTMYVTGDSAGLVGFMGVPTDQAARLADQWISVRPGQSLGQNTYSDIADGITLSSVASEIQVDSPLTLTAPMIADGQRVVGVQGSAPAGQQTPGTARVTLDVMASGTPLPVLYTASAAGGYQTRIAFSQWGEAVALTVPAGAIPATSTQTPILA